MVTVEWMTQEILKVVPDAIVEATDLHGSGDHFHVRVTSESYEGGYCRFRDRNQY